MVNYQLGKIYKIVCNVTGQVYVGSTCEPTLAKRLSKHVDSYRCWLGGKSHYVTSFKVLENYDFDIVLLENYPCSSKDELFVRERYFTNEIDCVNKCKNQGLLIELGKKEYRKQYLEQHEHEIKQSKKIYYDKNRIQLIEKKRLYDHINRIQIREKKNQKCTCECGRYYCLGHKARHMKSPIHKQYIELLKYENIRKGLEIIKKLDKHFNTL